MLPEATSSHVASCFVVAPRTYHLGRELQQARQDFLTLIQVRVGPER